MPMRPRFRPGVRSKGRGVAATVAPCHPMPALRGHGGVAAEAAKLDLPFLGEIPLALEVRIAGDSGTPIAAGEGPVAEAYARLAHRLVAGGMA